MRKTMVALVMSAALTAWPGVAMAGQGPGNVDDVKGEVSPEDLEAKAQQLFETPKKYGEAVKLFVKAADLRSPGDPMRITDLVMASRLSYYAGKETRAAELMERAADEAHAAGDVVGAANAYIDASFLAQAAGNGVKVPELVKKAQLLTSSPLLAASEREKILKRIAA
jgi:hypothetical protein